MTGELFNSCLSGWLAKMKKNKVNWERSQQRLVCSLLEGKRIVKTRFQRGTGMMVLKLFLQQGGEIVIEPVITKRGYQGLMVTSGNEASPLKYQPCQRIG